MSLLNQAALLLTQNQADLYRRAAHEIPYETNNPTPDPKIAFRQLRTLSLKIIRATDHS